MARIQNLKIFVLSHKRHCLWAFGIALFVLCIIWTDPTIHERGTIKIWDRNHILLYELAGSVGSKIPVTYDQLPARFIHAVIASEDETFWTNPGIDVFAIFRALLTNFKAGHIVSGASTITQQLVRVSVLDERGTPTRNMFRKLREVAIALRLTAVRSKLDIFSLYVNSMYFGNLSYGIGAASRTYFHKNPDQLSLGESSFLAGLLSSPDARNPYTNLDDALIREHHVLDLMVQHRFITSNQSNEAKSESIVPLAADTIIKAPHFVSHVLDQLDALYVPTTRGVNVVTTLDYSAYTLAQDIAATWIQNISAAHDLSNGALVLLQNQTGEILVMLGGTDYGDTLHAGQVNMAVSKRQPGSALKPFTYAAAFARGMTPATLLYDVQTVFRTKKGEGYSPNNYDGKFHGLVLAREALASSFNVPAVSVLQRIGIDALLETARRAGIQSLTDRDRYDLSLTLGGGEVTLLELTDAYATFARGGMYKEPYAITSVVTDDGNTIYRHRDMSASQAFGTHGNLISYLITDILSDPLARIPGFGEKNPLVLSHPAAVKTGTTTDWHDNWTVGYTPSYTVGVWVGNNDNHAMKEITGVTGAAPIWNQFLEEYLKGKPVELFVRPDGLRESEICAVTGLLADELCSDRAREIFINGTEPTTIGTMMQKITIDKRNGLLASRDCPDSMKEEKTFIVYPPQAYTWAVINNQPVAPSVYSPLCATGVGGQTVIYIVITNPRAKTVYENAPLVVLHQVIDFEANVSSDIHSVEWIIDGAQKHTANVFPFTYSFMPATGQHTVKAIGFTVSGQRIESDIVPFRVIDYKSNF